MTARPLCFISYSHHDRDFVDFLVRMLSLYGDHLEIWRDESGVERGPTFPPQIMAALDRAEVFIPVVSSHFLGSDWCRREGDYFIARRMKEDRLRIIPVHLEQLGEDLSPFREWINVDLQSWRRDGDRIVRVQLIHALLGQKPAVEPFVARTNASNGLNLARDYRTLGLVINRIDPEAKMARAFLQLGVGIFNLEGMPSIAQALVAMTIAGQKLQAGAWNDLAHWARAALNVLTSDSAAMTDDELGIVGELYNLLALAERKLGSGQAFECYLRALESFSAIADPLTRHAKLAQAHRELGTLALGAGQLNEAYRHFDESRSLLADLPSERMHHAQASIKLAQLALVDQRPEVALQELDRVALLFGRAQADGELERRVAAHYWRTRAFAAFVTGARGQFADAIDALRDIIEGTAWRNEHQQLALLRALYFLGLISPKSLRSRLTEAAIRIGSADLRTYLLQRSRSLEQ